MKLGTASYDEAAVHYALSICSLCLKKLFIKFGVVSCSYCLEQLLMLAGITGCCLDKLFMLF